jgi:hypothetical protein
MKRTTGSAMSTPKPPRRQEIERTIDRNRKAIDASKRQSEHTRNAVQQSSRIISRALDRLNYQR